MIKFEKAFQFILEREGGYVNDPDDPGGETKFGITKKYHPSVSIPELTIEQAREIYRLMYWEKLGCEEMLSPWNLIIFDAAVNQGQGYAFTLKRMIGEFLCPSDAIIERLKRYAKHPKRSKYMNGWVSRMLALQELIDG